MRATSAQIVAQTDLEFVAIYLDYILADKPEPKPEGRSRDQFLHYLGAQYGAEEAFKHAIEVMRGNQA